MKTGPGSRGLAAPYALFTGFAALFALGTVTAALHGRLTAAGVLIVAAAIVGAVGLVAQPLAAPFLAAIGWLTAVGYSRPPYADLRPTGPLAARAAVIMAATALAAALAGWLLRWWAARSILEVMHGSPAHRQEGAGPYARDAAPRGWERGWLANRVADPIDRRRRLGGLALGLAGLPALTGVLIAARGSLSLIDDLLIYLVVVVALAVIGGFWPAVLAAVAASLLLNWFFTQPLHTFFVNAPQDLLALLLFVTVAVAVSSVVHLAARRAVQAARSREEAGALLALAQTVLGGADTPAAVLGHLVATLGGRATLAERVNGRWVPIATAGGPAGDAEGGAGTGGASPAAGGGTRLEVRDDLALEVAGQSGTATPGLLAGFAAQAAAALDRERLRTQAAQAEALAEGNRMRTALLAAVSHDLRTPLASIKASVSSLRQTDVRWSAADTEALLATIEQNADRLDGVIGNLLDMSRLHTGSLQPFLRPTTVDEVAPIALHGLDDSACVRLAVPDGLPLMLADPGLLERVLANLFSNALQHSPPSRPPQLRAFQRGGSVVLAVADHGQGVPDGMKQLIFEPFQRLDHRGAGVGLGLAVAKGFTEAMGGSIAATDTPGGGLTVAVTLPVASTEGRPVVGAGP